MAEQVKPSGWRRLWVVASILFGAPILIGAFQSYRDFEYLTDVPLYEVRMRAEAALRNDMSCTRGDGQWTHRPAYPERSVRAMVPPYSREYPGDPTVPPRELTNKIVEQDLMNVSVECEGTLPQSWWWMAILPAAFMAAVGLTVRWVYRGFRPSPSS